MIAAAYALAAIALMAAVTFALRALPFVAGRWLRTQPLVRRLEAMLPLAIMTLLVLDTARGQALARGGWPWPEALAVVVVLALQLRLRRPLLAMAAGTVLYMLLRAG